MAKAEMSDALRPVRRAMFYRDGLMIALLASRPIRRKNLVRLEIGRQIVKTGNVWTLNIPARETKNRQRVEMNLPIELCPAMDRYIDCYRPRFPHRTKSRRLWLARYGAPLEHDGVYWAFERHTRAEFGVPVSPQLFRTAAVTTIATVDPTNIGIAHRLLAHAHPGTADRYYNRAPTLDASRRYQEHLIRLRSSLDV
jgi:integrase